MTMIQTKIKTGLLLLSLLVNQLTGIGQDEPSTPLHIGDHVPNIPLTLQVGDSVRHIHMQDLSGTAAVFDTWNLGCPVCIASMPHMLALEQAFKGRIKVIYVSANPAEDVKKWFEKRKAHYNPKIIDAAKQLTFLYEGGQDHGRELSFYYGHAVDGLFEHYGNPTHIWIDQHGIYQARTAGDETNEAVINEFLDGKMNGKDEQLIAKPFAFLDALEGSPGDDQYYCYIRKQPFTEVENGSDAIQIDSATQRIVGYRKSHETPFWLYSALAYRQYAGKELEYLTSAQIVWEVKNPLDFIEPASLPLDQQGKWIAAHSYCYAVRVPLSRANQLDDIVRQDLDRYFNVESRMETRKIPCFVLKRIGVEDKIRAPHPGEGGFDGYDYSLNKLVLRNATFSRLLQMLRLMVETPAAITTPFIDETKYAQDEPIDIALPLYYQGQIQMLSGSDFRVDLDALRKVLNQYGLDLVKEYRERQVLVIRGKDYHQENKAKEAK
jgi:thiol-disulfide isomerase/thioredoxin